jgi:hypothetical protein
LTNYDDWISLLAQKARRMPIVFLQLGAAHQPAREALSDWAELLLTVSDYLDTAIPVDQEIVVIDQIETLVDARYGGQLGQLRERVFQDVDDGRKVILLSRSPRASYGAVPGSSLLDDASFAHGPNLDVDRFELLPACRLNGQTPDLTLHQALEELGAEVCASLDRVIYEDLLIGAEALQSLSARELEALDGAAITSVKSNIRQWNFAKHLVQLKDALCLVIAEQANAQPELIDVSSGLWRIERMIRRAVRNRAVAAWGSGWRTQCLNAALVSEVMVRATESAYLSARSIKQIRDPLEWLSLGELLALRDKSQIGNLGMSPALWRQFAAQVMPIRNRLAHMRFLHPTDGTDIIRWLKVLEEKLDIKGSL